MKTIAFTCVILLLSLTNQGQTIMKKTNGVEKKITDIHTELYKALLEKHQGTLNNSLHDKFTFISADAVLMNKDKFINGFAMNPEIKFNVLTSSDENLIIVGKAAVLTAVVHITISKGGQPRSIIERVTETYTVFKKEWVLLGMQATYYIPEH